VLSKKKPHFLEIQENLKFSKIKPQQAVTAKVPPKHLAQHFLQEGKA